MNVDEIFSTLYTTFHMNFLFLFFYILSYPTVLTAKLHQDNHDFYGEQSFVIGVVSCQLGNNMFQVAAASALAWDNHVDAYFPGIPNQYKPHKHVFSRCNFGLPESSITSTWQEPSHKYHPIPFTPNMSIVGYFQSEKYFAHHREKILELFKPLDEDVQYIMETYGHLLENPKSVGIHLRWYFEDGAGKVFIQYGRHYLKRAISNFPKDSLFIVCSNNPEFARQNMPKIAKNVVYIENEPDYIDLYLLSLCKNNIITNSTFGWWGAWLNQNPEKKVIAPYDWLHPGNGPSTSGVVPKSWKKIKARWGPSPYPETYQ